MLGRFGTHRVLDEPELEDAAEAGLDFIRGGCGRKRQRQLAVLTGERSLPGKGELPLSGVALRRLRQDHDLNGGLVPVGDVLDERRRRLHSRVTWFAGEMDSNDGF